MVYTEIKERNGKRYFYRVISIREGKKVNKKREYLGCNLSDLEVISREKEADEKLMPKKNKGIKEGINRIKPKIIHILKKNKVKKAGIFGSYARGEQKKNSDVDILVEISDKNMSLLGFIELKLKLEDALRRKIDLVEYNSIKPLIKEKILNEEIKIL